MNSVPDSPKGITLPAPKVVCVFVFHPEVVRAILLLAWRFRKLHENTKIKITWAQIVT